MEKNMNIYHWILNRGWDGWMASLTPWTWVWASSGCWWWTGRPGVLQSMGSQRVRHDWATELNWVSGDQRRDSAIHIHCPLKPPPMHVDIKYWAKFHVLCNRFLLVIHFKYSSVYMTFPKSLTLPSPLATISSFSKSVSLFLFCKFICIISS